MRVHSYTGLDHWMQTFSCYWLEHGHREMDSVSPTTRIHYLEHSSLCCPFNGTTLFSWYRSSIFRSTCGILSMHPWSSQNLAIWSRKLSLTLVCAWEREKKGKQNRKGDLKKQEREGMNYLENKCRMIMINSFLFVDLCFLWYGRAEEVWKDPNSADWGVLVESVIPNVSVWLHNLYWKD